MVSVEKLTDAINNPFMYAFSYREMSSELNPLSDTREGGVFFLELCVGHRGT